MFPKPLLFPNAVEVGEEILGVVCFGLYLLPLGYLAERLPSLRRPTGCGAAERTLWALALGVPLSVLLCVLGRRIMPGSTVNVLYLAALFGAVLLWRRASVQQGSSSPHRRVRRSTRIAMCLAAAFALYCIVQGADVQIGHHVYVGTMITDWSVRVTMVASAMRSGVPPINGLSTVSAGGLGHAANLRYYYYWYVMVAQMADTFHLDAQPALVASCVWAGWSFVASAMLGLKYLLGARQRRLYLLLMFLLTVLGLDLLPTLWLWLSPSHHPYLEMEWWHQDRTPSFLGAVLYAPHHLASIGALMTGFLLLLRLAGPAGDEAVSPRWALSAVAIALAGCMFAAAAGLSLFPTFCFVVVLSFWAVDLARRRAWVVLGSLAMAGIFSLILSHAYLTELSTGTSAASSFVSFAWRQQDFVAGQLQRVAALRQLGPWPSFFLRQSVVLALDLFELGVYALVLVAAVRRDLLAPGRLTPGRCGWWALVTGAGFTAFFLTSVGSGGPNDLGVDAGLLLRFALQLWAVEWLWRLRAAQASATAIRPVWTFRAAVVLLALGLGAQLYQVLSIRFYLPLLGSGAVAKQMDWFTQDHLSERVYNIRSALTEFNRKVPPSRPDTEAVQFNPIGVMTPMEVYFNRHQIASWDSGCGTSFGGDYAACRPIYASLVTLFGNTSQGANLAKAPNRVQDGSASPVPGLPAFEGVCRLLHLRAVLADATDSIWSHPDSWVWTGPVLVANSTVRVIGCPAGSWRP